MFEYSDGYSTQDSRNSTGAGSYSGSYQGTFGDIKAGSSAGKTVLAKAPSGVDIEVPNGGSSASDDQVAQDGRPDLGPVGNAIRNRAGSEFSMDMFENYWLGKGDVILSQERFIDIWDEALDVDPKGMARKGTEHRLPNGAVVFSKVIRLYASEEYKYAFGAATLIFDENDLPVGFYDYYNFDKKNGSRSDDAERKTRMVREASRLSPTARPLRIGYGKVPREIFSLRD